MASESSSLEDVAKEVETFFCSALDTSALQTLDRPIRQVTENIRLNKKLLEKNASVVDDYLTNKSL